LPKALVDEYAEFYKNESFVFQFCKIMAEKSYKTKNGYRDFIFQESILNIDTGINNIKNLMK